MSDIFDYILDSGYELYFGLDGIFVFPLPEYYICMDVISCTKNHKQSFRAVSFDMGESEYSPYHLNQIINN